MALFSERFGFYPQAEEPADLLFDKIPKKARAVAVATLIHYMQYIGWNEDKSHNEFHAAIGQPPVLPLPEVVTDADIEKRTFRGRLLDCEWYHFFDYCESLVNRIYKLTQRPPAKAGGLGLRLKAALCG